MLKNCKITMMKYSYQTYKLKKLMVGERHGHLLLQLLPQLVSPEIIHHDFWRTLKKYMLDYL